MTRLTGGNSLLDANFILEQAQVGEDMRVVDLGCGNGHFVFIASDLVGKGGKVYAVDILKTVLETVGKRAESENLENIETVWSNLEIFGATKINPASIDVGMLINTLYQSHKRAEIIREAVRILKKGGYLLIVEWKKTANLVGPPVEERVRQDIIKEVAKKAGLNLEKEFEAGQFHYGMLFQKM